MKLAVRLARACTSLVVALAAVLTLAGCASVTVAGQAATPASRHAAQSGAGVAAPSTARDTTAAVTARHTYDPWTAAGTLSVPVARTVTGSCFTASIAAPGAGTYRCLAGNLLLDPCFAHGTSRTLACEASPGSAAVLLHSTKALPGGPAYAARIWTVRTSNGLTCTAATGTVPQVDRVDLDYVCGHGISAALTGTGRKLVGAVYATADAHTLRHTTVTALWRAASAR